jgi:thioesterase domain-containing protein
MYVLDQALHLVPVGISGELYIAGAGVARGYLHRPDLTAERFIPNPFSPEPGSRFYKTGDTARYLPDGNLEFLGRRDHQVKIRGFRIELEEIEAVLGQYPAVQETVVLAREDVPGAKRLVAYVVPRQEQSPTDSALRRFLQDKLPDYMVPASCVFLEKFPLTPNGKIDRQALPAPEPTRRPSQDTVVAPRDHLELQLVHIWESILEIRPIGVTENFFDLGGHSLLAIRLMAQMQQQFGQKLPLAVLFQGATISELAGLLRQQDSTFPHSSLVAVQPGGTKRPFFWLPPAGGSVLCYLDLARALGPEQPLYGLHHPGLEGGQPSVMGLEEIAAYYLQVLRTHQPEGPYLLGGWSMGGMVAFEMAQQLVAQRQEVALLALADTRCRIPSERPRDIEQATLLSRFAQQLGFALDGSSLAHLAPEAQLAVVLAQARAVRVVTTDVGITQLRRHMQVFVSNMKALQGYTPHAYPGQIVLFRACDESDEYAVQDLTLGWDRVATRGVLSHTIPGDHYTMLHPPHVQLVAQCLRSYLEAAQERS